jgi:hypothetical protein
MEDEEETRAVSDVDHQTRSTEPRDENKETTSSMTSPELQK